MFEEFWLIFSFCSKCHTNLLPQLYAKLQNYFENLITNNFYEKTITTAVETNKNNHSI